MKTEISVKAFKKGDVEKVVGTLGSEEDDDAEYPAVSKKKGILDIYKN